MFKKMAVLLFLALFSANLCGCAVALLAGGALVGGLGTSHWVSGKLVQEVDTPYDKTIQASKSALESLGLDIVRATKKRNIAQVMSKYTDGKTIWIDIHNVADSAARLEIRVGAISDKEAAQIILDRIKRYL